MDLKAFLHEHYLLLDEYGKQEARCHICNQQINGWAYTCESCNFWVHDLCAGLELPGKISHPLHPQHILEKFFQHDRGYICTRCLNLSRGHRYRCKKCHFNLDLSCAFSISYNDDDLKSKEIRHFCSSDPLALLNYRRVGKYDYSCSWCERHLSGVCYGNVEGICDTVLFHESCLHKIPSIISKHPFHPSHPLQILYLHSWPYCNACKYHVIQAYCCRHCKFHLHVGCAKRPPSLKVELHEHELTYFQSNSYRTALPCKICNQDFGVESSKETGLYRCVPCDFSYHFDCIGIPSSVKHKYHRHPLELVGLFIEDDSTEFYCDICEEERKPDHHVYCCKKCKFVAHIERAVNKVPLLGAKEELMEKEETEQKNENFPRNYLDIEYFDHSHPLSFIETVEQNKKLFCNACGFEISGQCYTCKSCEYYLHRACSMLPYEVLHPLHPQHSVKLFTDLDKPFTCHECRYHSYGFVYKCYPCDFQLDVVCATRTTPPKNEDQRLTKIERVSKLCPFDPNHELEFFNRRTNLKEDLRCEACYRSIVGSAYSCPECASWLVFDESCLESLKEMQHPFHPLHPIRPLAMLDESCSVCQTVIDICYGCEHCDFYLDLDCARALKLSPLNFKYHSHHLFYFGPDSPKYQTCDKCKKSCSAPFYFCFKCSIYLHLECVPIPMSVKSKCHIHRLTLKDCVIEDNSGEYYCDICEEERNPNYHVYCCEECDGLFIAHIECVLPMMEETEIFNHDDKTLSKQMAHGTTDMKQHDE